MLGIFCGLLRIPCHLSQLCSLAWAAGLWSFLVAFLPSGFSLGSPGKRQRDERGYFPSGFLSVGCPWSACVYDSSPVTALPCPYMPLCY